MNINLTMRTLCLINHELINIYPCLAHNLFLSCFLVNIKLYMQQHTEFIFFHNQFLQYLFLVKDSDTTIYTLYTQELNIFIFESISLYFLKYPLKKIFFYESFNISKLLIIISADRPLRLPEMYCNLVVQFSTTLSTIWVRIKPIGLASISSKVAGINQRLNIILKEKNLDAFSAQLISQLLEITHLPNVDLSKAIVLSGCMACSFVLLEPDPFHIYAIQPRSEKQIIMVLDRSPLTSIIS